MITERLLTPTKITAWLDCAHFLTLQHQLDDSTLTVERQGFGEFAQLLADKGLDHEQACLEQYRADGLSVFEVPPRNRGETFAEWATRSAPALDGDHDVIYQLPLVHDGMRGVADFVVRSSDRSGWEPVDSKLARVEAKPGHVLQLCFYADALEAATGTAPEQMTLWLGSGQFEHVRTDAVRPYWNRLRVQLRQLLTAEGPQGDTGPEPCDHCEFCDFERHCTEQLRDEDSLVFVAGLRAADRRAFEEADVSTLAQLAEHPLNEMVEGVRDDKALRAVRQAVLQVTERDSDETTPPFRLIEQGDDPTWGHGFELLPEPDDGDIFLDFEGHPFWRADSGLFFLFGWIERDEDGDWRYRTVWAHDLVEEAAATAELIDFLADRRSAYPEMHVYHYNHTERSSLERLAALHAVGESTLATLVETGAMIDLYPVVQNALQAGVESYGLKNVELLAGYRRGHDIDAGAGAVVEYEHFRNGDETALERIAAYNEDDVRATRALRDWLVEQRSDDMAWRVAEFEADEDFPDIDDKVAALHQFEPGSPEHLLGDLLGYWQREWRATMGPRFAILAAGGQPLLDNAEVIGSLEPVGLIDRLGKNDKVLGVPGMQFNFPPQTLSSDLRPDSTLRYEGPDGAFLRAKIDQIDVDAGELVLQWNGASQDAGVVPVAAVLDDWVPAGSKSDSLIAVGANVLDAGDGVDSPVARELLGRALPRFAAGGGPVHGIFTDDVDAICDWVAALDCSVVAVQGPPGTGKTFTGSHVIRGLLADGKRVGVTGPSHSAIDNLLEATVELLHEHGELDSIQVGRQNAQQAQRGLKNVSVVDSKRCVNDGYELIAGTAWMFSREDLRDRPVDVLVIDEAGQVSLADALTCAPGARNIVLLGDPLQLEQVSKAAHPGAAGASVLQHVLGDEDTMPENRGSFLSETRRMHPNVCEFISDRIYEGRLTSHQSCKQQTTEFGTGLRWLRSEHTGRITESPEEADLIAQQIRRILGTKWTNQQGESAELTVGDVMVVVPYNDQRRLLRTILDADEVTAGVPVGTVDKFQGREAPVVFFSMTASTAAEVPRGTDFLFSRQRLNVAVSRARCLAFLVCTEELLDSRARDVEEMRLLSTLAAFVEHSEPDEPRP